MAVWSECLELLPSRLLQDHSPSGEPRYTALVKNPRSSGELLVNEAELSA